jgi:hypothetical protein
MLQILLTSGDSAFFGERWSSERSLFFNHAGFHSLRAAQRSRYMQDLSHCSVPVYRK